MIDFYYNLGPNPMKVALFLEESGLPYRPLGVDTMKGEQFEPAFLDINPNAKLPAIVDGDVTVFDSNAILLYLAEKTRLFLPRDTPANRGQLLSWLMFVASGVGPYSGQSVHFRKSATERIEYAIKRYRFEAKRHWGVIDQRLDAAPFMLGDTYTIVDMAVWGWAKFLGNVFFGEAPFDGLDNVKRHFDAISARPAAQRVEGLKAQYAFKLELDAEARSHMFRHTVTP